MRHDDIDANKRYFRSSERVFRMNGSWYFAAREGDQGPFASERVAHDEVTRYLSEKKELANFQQAREDAAGSLASLSLVPLDEREYHRPEPVSVRNRKVMV